MLNPFVGPIPLPIFFEKFMHASNVVKDTCPIIDSSFLNSLTRNEVEIGKSKMERCDMMLHFFKDHPYLLPGFKLVDTSQNRKSKISDRSWSIDLTCYRNDIEVSDRDSDLGKAEWTIAFDEDDAFGDNESFILACNNAKRTRNGLCLYAAEWFNHQHRTHGFIVFIADKVARFLYFDRSGGVVTENFDYTVNPVPLIRFMWYIAHMSDEQRGTDPTVRPASPLQAQKYLEQLRIFYRRVAMTEVNPKMIEVLKSKEQHAGRRNEVLTDEDWERLWKLADGDISSLLSRSDIQRAEDMAEKRMPSKSSTVIVIQVPEGNRFREVVGHDVFMSDEPLVGRATRACPVWDVKANKLVYLKDSWRICTPEAVDETTILLDLRNTGVSYVPSITCGGDIANQKTLASAFDEDVLTPRAHHRFLVDFIGRPLDNFSDSKQMLQATYDAFRGHREAWEKCGILHRDISQNNVMLDRWGRGVLNDWDLARRKTDEGQSRTGTWYFMSTLLTMRPHKRHEVQDDIESFVLLVLYQGLSYLKHNLDIELDYFFKKFFDESCIDVNGNEKGGVWKFGTFSTPKAFIKGFEFEGNAPLSLWMKRAWSAVGIWINNYIRYTLSLSDTEDSDDSDIRDLPSLESELRKSKLYDHRYFVKIFEDALAHPGWPEMDRVENNILGNNISSVSRL